MDVSAQYLNQLDDVIDDYKRNEQLMRISDEQAGRAGMAFLTRARAVLQRVAGYNSPYLEQCEAVLDESAHEGWKANRIVGILESLRADVSAGYLRSASQLIHGEVFSDFLDMADHLLSEGYKDPAAVVAGSALEVHLRTLCEQAGVDCSTDGRAHKAERMNTDLAAASAYSKLDQKNVTSWLGLRNDAAHGNYTAYTADQVRLYTASIRDFICRNPA